MFENPRHRKQAEAFDAIDTLRHAQLSPRIDTPQIVLCGEYSSDKDSLLEALTRSPFPKRSWDMQCCVTELAMRQASKTRAISHIETLRLFRKAVAHLDQLQSASGYWYGTLRIELSGPSQSPLTLIDLPALYRTKTQERSSEDVAAILKLVRLYLYKPHTIILAVVNAIWNSELQLIRDIMNSELAIYK